MTEDFTTQAEFRAFERQFNKVRKANAQVRVDAVGLLTPELLRKHLKSGQDLVLQYGRRGATVTYTLADLQKFAKAVKTTKDTHRDKVAGVPLLQLEAASRPEDHERSRQQIKNATLYRIHNNILHFQVSASGENGKQYYQVRVRLEEWYDNMTDPRTWLSAARNCAVGRLSFDCGCGRHQYWYRYLATIGGFALSPLEKDFPKIRNPQLTGCCCKHVLKVLKQLKSASVHGLIAKELERQSKSAGYVDNKASKYLNKAELQKAKRAKGSDRDSEAAKRAYEEFQAARNTFKKQAKNLERKNRVKELTAKLKAQEARAKAIERKLADQERKAKNDALAAKLSQALNMAKKYKLPQDEVLSDFATENGLKREEVTKLVEGYKL